MNEMNKLLYTAKIHTTGGREGGEAKSSDGRLHVHFTVPGAPGEGTNPEQMFGAGWSACFESAIAIAARKKKVALPPDLAIDAEVDLNLIGGNYTLGARLNVSLPGLPRDVAQSLVEQAEQLCPYSRAVKGNIDAVIRLV
ncbi:MAG TPA: Ohr family peroxiredoxin [Candidatus Cybelea sp.]|nr:Ohr family peroxiredoxin [Candidatus Cybelea sp.]